MPEKRGLAILAMSMAILVAITGCIGGSDEQTPNKKPKLSLEVIFDDLKVARGENFTIFALAQNNKDETYNVSFSIDSIPKGFTIDILNDTQQLLRHRQKATMIRVYVEETASLGNTIFFVKAKFLEKSSITNKVKVKLDVIEPSAGDVRSKDNVQVDYLGFLDNGKVFDTSVGDIGRNTNVEKSEDWKGHGDTYSPMKVIVDSGGVVQGFNDAIKGLEIGQTRTVMVPPEMGYANMLDATINRTERVHMVQEMEWNTFVNEFGEVPAENKVVKDPFWEWSVQVIDLEGTNVTILINPQGLMNKTVNPYGWDSKIVSIDSTANGGMGEIVIEHHPAPGVNVTFRGKEGRISAQDNSRITITYNDSDNPLSHVNMWFQVTLIKVG